MSKILSGLVLTFSCLALLCGPAQAQEPRLVLRAIVQKAAALPSVPGMSVAVANQTGVVWSAGFGFSDLENRLPMTTNTKTRIGSVAKVLTTAGLMKLYENGLIDFDANVRTLVG